MKVILIHGFFLYFIIYLNQNKSTASGHLTSFDLIRCPVVPPIRSFDNNRFSGIWYHSWIIRLPDGSPVPKCASEVIIELTGGQMNAHTRVSDVDGRVFYRNGKLVPGKYVSISNHP